MATFSRAGDHGQTRLPDGAVIPKDAARLEAVGTIDELNGALGLVRAERLPEDLDRLLEERQRDLCTMMAELAAEDPARLPGGRLGPHHLEPLEQAIDRYHQTLEPLWQFILPAGCRAGAALHFARTVCRRAERRLVTLARQAPPPVSAVCTAYLNRLADLLFVLARAVNREAGRGEVPWRQET